MPIKNFNPGSTKKRRSLTLILTKECNLRCSYCYEKHSERDDEEMDFDIVKRSIIECMENSLDFDGVEIEFFGGEPMLCFPLIQKTVEWFQSREWPIPYKFLIGTNGTLLTDEMKDWLYQKRENLNIAVSLDGNKTAHDLARDNSYDLVFANMPFFLKYWRHQPVKMTVADKTIPYLADSIIDLEEKGINFTANIVFEDCWGNLENKKKLLKIYDEQLTRLVDYYIENPHLYPVRPMLSPIPGYLGLVNFNDAAHKSRDCIRFCGAGHEMTTVDVDGTIYPCHRFLPWVTGRDAPKTPVNRQQDWKPTECSACKLIESCSTCVGFNWEINGNTGHRTTFHCEAYKMEVLASCKLESERLAMRLPELDDLSLKEKAQIKGRLEAIWSIIEDGV